MAGGGRGESYNRILETIFFDHYTEGDDSVTFAREEIVSVSNRLGIDPPKNLGDLVYYFRYRFPLPQSIIDKAPPGQEWVILSGGRSIYRFVGSSQTNIRPTLLKAATKIPDATPGIIERYAKSDEQALLAKLRYNRLIDIFTGVACYSLQNHLRTSVKGIGQVETDEVYVGVDSRGAHYVFPVQAKGGADKLSVVQIEQDFGLCAQHFPGLICRPIAAQFMEKNLIALFDFENSTGEVRLLSESHYFLVPGDALDEADLATYRTRPKRLD